MPKPNAYVLQLEQRMKDHARVAQYTEVRQGLDALIIAANDEFGFGADRIERLISRWIATRIELADMVLDDRFGVTKDKEFIYSRTKIDNRLRQIMGPDYPCHEKRYVVNIGKTLFNGGVVIK